MKKCCVPGCTNNNLRVIRGYCFNHYQNLRNSGSLNKIYGSKNCSVQDCKNKYYCSGYCSLHYNRISRSGTIDARPMRVHGTGCVTPYGYLRISTYNGYKFAHVAVAEKALGKQLPQKAHVHHIDGNKLNNNSTNLVICPDNAYHMLIEARTRAYNACGYGSWRKCKFCKKYDDIVNMTHHKGTRNINDNGSYYHLECRRLHRKIVINK